MEDIDNDGNEMASHGPPIVNDEEEGDDDDDDEMGAHGPPMAGIPPLVNLAQQPDNPPGKF